MKNLLCILCVVVLAQYVGSMAPPVAVIHIGPHKTATTYIQSLLYSLRDNLSAERIVPIRNEDFINDSFSPPTNVVFLGHALGSRAATTKNHVLASFGRLMKRHLESGSGVILSSESFDLQDVNVSILAQMLQGFKPMVVIVTRNWMSMLLSTYFQECRRLDGVIKRCQSIPQGKEISFQNYLRFNDRLTTNQSVLMQERFALHLADRYARQFGALNIRILDFDGLMASRTNIGQAFLRLLTPHTSASFQATVRERTATTPPANEAKPLYYTQIIRSAKQRKLIPPDCDNFDGNAHWVPPAAQPLPKQCLSPETKQTLLDISLAMDTQLRRKWSLAIVGGSREAAVAAMRRAVASDFRLCWVREDDFFASDFWLQWLREEIAAKCGPQ